MATATLPPDYQAALADIEKIKGQLTPEAQERAEVAMAAEMAKPETDQKLLDDVKALGDAAIKVDQAFVRVSGELNVVDENNYTDAQGKPIPRLKPTWDSFHERFKVMLWSSRDVATDTAVYILDFYDVYLPTIEDILTALPTATPEQAKEMVQDIQKDFLEFIQKPNPATATSDRPVPPGADPLTISQAHSQGFLDLKNDIAAFKDTFSSFADHTSTDLQTQLSQIDNKITRLTAEIATYTKLVESLGIAMGVTVGATAVGAAGAFFAFGPVGPAVAVGVLIVGALAVIGELAALIVYLEKKADAEDELVVARRDKASLETQLATLAGLKSKLQTQSTDITYICGRLDQFANIWSLVASDARAVNGVLIQASTTTAWRILAKRVALLKRSYASLYTGLRAYATNVTDSGVPQPQGK